MPLKTCTVGVGRNLWINKSGRNLCGSDLGAPGREEERGRNKVGENGRERHHSRHGEMFQFCTDAVEFLPRGQAIISYV